MAAANPLRRKLRAGEVYRRADLVRWSNSIDRHLRQLLEEGCLVRICRGLYMAPRKTRFSDAPADPRKIVERFLQDSRFLIVPPSAFNGLGVGATQLYNETMIVNAKRRGRIELDGRMFRCRRTPRFPNRLSEEYLLVLLVDSLDLLAEDERAVLDRVRKRVKKVDRKKLVAAVRDFGGRRAKRVFAPLFPGTSVG